MQFGLSQKREVSDLHMAKNYERIQQKLKKEDDTNVNTTENRQKLEVMILSNKSSVGKANH